MHPAANSWVWCNTNTLTVDISLRLAPQIMLYISLAYNIILFIMVCQSREIILYPAMLYGHKPEACYCAFSCLGHGPYIRRSNLAKYKFTFVLLV